MPLFFYNEVPFSINNQLDPDDTFLGNGVQTAFTLTAKPGTRLASTIQQDNNQYYQYTGGFTKAGNTFTVNSTPPAGSQIVAPGINALTMAAFDQASVDGVTNPRVSQAPFWLADISTIHLNKYLNNPSLPGIEISFVDLASAATATLAWVQLACSDANGNALTFQATATALYTDGLYAFTTLATSASAGSITCQVASSIYTWQPGDYLMFNIGQNNQEVVRLKAINGNIFIVSGFNFNHNTGEPLWTCGRQFWAQETVPLNATNNIAANFYNIALRRKGIIQARP